jgi:hypothetical protein
MVGPSSLPAAGSPSLTKLVAHELGHYILGLASRRERQSRATSGIRFATVSADHTFGFNSAPTRQNAKRDTSIDTAPPPACRNEPRSAACLARSYCAANRQSAPARLSHRQGPGHHLKGDHDGRH